MSNVIFKIENIKPDLLNEISEMTKNKNISEEEVVIELIEEGIEIYIKNKILEYLATNKDTYNSNLTKEELNSIVEIMQCTRWV